MRVFDRIIVGECPPENGSVLWVDTSRETLSLKMKYKGAWEVIGCSQETLEKIVKILGEFANPTETVATDLEYIRQFLTEATEAEIYAMFPAEGD